MPAFRKAGWLAAGVLIVAYLLQLASPLRLTTDAIAYLEIGRSIADGEGVRFAGEPTKYPPGYPAVVALLDLAGLASSAAFIAVNIACLALVVWAALRLARDALGISEGGLWSVGLVIPLSYLNVKHATLPLSDLTYACVSMVALLWISSAEARARLVPFGLGVVAVGAAIALRTAGVALLPALLWAVARPMGKPAGWVEKPRGKAVLSLVVLIAGATLIPAFLFSTYFDELRTIAEPSMGQGVARTVWGHVAELGEVALNLPRSRAGGGGGALEVVFGVVGIALLALVGRLLYRRRESLRSLDVYAVTFTLLTLFWPFEDARFWLPLVPILAIYAAGSVTRRVVRVYLIAFMLLGLAALGFSSWLSLSGDAFPERYGRGELQKTYQAAFGGRGVPDSDAQPLALRVLRRYERRAAE